MNNRADLNLLVVFDAIVACGSVSAAAERIALSQPAVSHALNRLRDLTGDPLFVRFRGGLKPTPRAEAMIAPTREILQTAGKIFSASAFDPALSVTRFRLGVSDYANAVLLPVLVREIRGLAPNIVLETAPAGHGTFERLEAGELDCSFWGSQIPSRQTARAATLFREKMVGMAAPDHPLAAKIRAGKVSLEDYLTCPHVVIAFGDPGQSPVDAALAAAGCKRRIAVATQSISTNMAVLKGSDLIASLPSRLSRFARDNGLLVFDLPFDVDEFDYALVWSRRVDADPACIWLRETIVRVAALLP